MQQYDLVALRSFVTVVEAGSFNRAAELLQASTASVSRRVSGLESALGVKLLYRTTRQLDLSEAGRLFYGDVVNILQSLEEAQERVQQGLALIKGTLRIAAPLSFGLQCLSPALPELMKRHPQLKVQLQLDDRIVDLVADSIDVAIRIGELKDSTLVATRIADIPRVFCASDDYLQRHGEPQKPAELVNHNCLYYSPTSTKEEWHFANETLEEPIELSSTLATNNGEVLKNSAIEGLGIALLPMFIAADALQDGRLKAILPHHNPKPFGLYAVKSTRQFTPIKVKVLIEYLTEICKRL